MASDKTVVQLCNELSRVTDCDGESVDEVDYLADLIVDAHIREVEELRECLKEAVEYFCGNDKLADCTEKVYGNPKCETEGQHCMVDRWRKALEGAKDGE